METVVLTLMAILSQWLSFG